MGREDSECSDMAADGEEMEGSTVSRSRIVCDSVIAMIMRLSGDSEDGNEKSEVIGGIPIDVATTT